MNRSISSVGIAIILAGIALAAFPIVVFGVEQLDLEQEAGILFAPIGLLVVLIGAVQPDPELTTVKGTFGSSEENFLRQMEQRSAEPTRAPLGFSPREPVDCRYCRTVITFDLARCPRCGRARECRVCLRTLGSAGDVAQCPSCRRVEAFCNCPRLARTTGLPRVAAHARRV